jgi:hypothetical protein
LKLIYGKKLPDLTKMPKTEKPLNVITENGYIEVIIDDSDTEIKNWLKATGFNET